MKQARITGVDLFCGVGGLTHGLVKAGVDITAGVDVDPHCRFPYEANNAAVFIERDVDELSAKEVARHFNESSMRLLAGCAPCQPFSTYSRSGRNLDHESQWPLLLAFGRLIGRIKPELVTMENVPQLAQHEVFSRFLQNLRGYKIWWSVVECANHGVPQTRKRLVLLASRFGDRGLHLNEPDGLQSTVREAIGGLGVLQAGESDSRDPLHTASSLSPINLRRIQASRPGGTWRDWPNALQAECHRKVSGATYPSVYGRMEWDKPGPTITTQSFGYGNGRFGHPEQDRALSLREAAMLQTFPRAYRFAPPGADIKFSRMGRLIGNAVPVKLGEAIGRALIRHVNETVN